MMLGTQIPRYNTTPEPEGFLEHHGEDAVFYAQQHGLRADPWQETTCKSWLRTTPDDKWVCNTAGVTVARQNGKNGSCEIVELYLMTQLHLHILHTAHEVPTARTAFQRLKEFFGESDNDPDAKYPHLNAMVKEVRNTNGQEAIILKGIVGGGSITFRARSKGAGRGSSKDVLIIDEAQELTEQQLKAQLPAISSPPSGQNLTIYMGTPPDLGELAKGIGKPFLKVRNQAIAGTRPVSWVEFGARGFVEDMSPAELLAFVQDEKNWAQGNPAYGRRIVRETIESELTQFDAESFCRERLNMWPKSLKTPPAIPMERWKPLGTDPPTPEVAATWQTAAFGLDMNRERSQVTISVSSFLPDDEHENTIALEIGITARFDDGGIPKLVDWLWKRAKRIHYIVIDGRSPAASLVPHLRKKKMKVRVLSAGEFVEASMGFYDSVIQDKSVMHFSEPFLDDSLASAGKLYTDKEGKQWKFTPLDMSVPFHPAMSGIIAHYGAVKFVRRRSSSDALAGAGHGFG